MTHEEMISKVRELLENDEELFNSSIEELDGWNGFLGDDRVYPMYELDDLFCGCSFTEFLDKLDNSYHGFNTSDEYFVCGIYGIYSTDEKDYSIYLDDNFIEDLYNNYTHLYLDSAITNIFEEYDNENENA